LGLEVFAFDSFRGIKFRIKQLQVADKPLEQAKDPSCMALDVYVGSLTRYYAGEWENIAERSARERGPRYHVAGRELFDGRDADEIRQAVIAWRTSLSQSLGERIAAPLDWSEEPEAAYYTGRPGWDGFGSLVLWAAYAEHPAVRRPASLPEEWDNDPVLMRSNAEGFRSRYSHMVRNVELWLPCTFEFTFEGEDVDGRRVVVGSAVILRRQLEELNAATWKASAGVVAGWGREPPVDEAPLEQNARHAFAVLLELASQAVEHRLPMKLDY
jgi:hypothetical protein